MDGPTATSAGLDPRRRRVLFRAWHRGMRETDLIMGGFAQAGVAAFSDADLDDFERLIEVQDRDVLAWITGEAPVPANYDTPVFQRMRLFHHHLRPLHG